MGFTLLHMRFLFQPNVSLGKLFTRYCNISLVLIISAHPHVKEHCTPNYFLALFIYTKKWQDVIYLRDANK